MPYKHELMLLICTKSRLYGNYLLPPLQICFQAVSYIYIFQLNLPKIYNRKIPIKRIYHATLISDFLNFFLVFSLKYECFIVSMIF